MPGIVLSYGNAEGTKKDVTYVSWRWDLEEKTENRLAETKITDVVDRKGRVQRTMRVGEVVGLDKASQK